jgi:predicted DNA-binding transcriptional regulator AlpA
MHEESTMTGLERLISTRELAEYLGVAPQALDDLRTAGRGPRAVHVGRELRYRISEFQAWLDRQSGPVGAPGGADHARQAVHP